MKDRKYSRDAEVKTLIESFVTEAVSDNEEDNVCSDFWNNLEACESAPSQGERDIFKHTSNTPGGIRGVGQHKSRAQLLRENCKR